MESGLEKNDFSVNMPPMKTLRFPWLVLGGILMVAGCHKPDSEEANAVSKDPNARDANGKTALITAIEKGQSSTALELLEKGANVSEGYGGEAPIQMAARLGQKEVVEQLLAKGADPMTKNTYGVTCLHLASTRPIAEIFVEKGIDVNVKSVYRECPLHLAAERGNADVVEFLLEKGADVKARAKDGDIMPLNYASTRQVAALLESNGAPVKGESNSWGRNTPPIYSAALAGRTEVVEFLIEKGADLNAKPYSGQTPIAAAAEKGHTEVVELLAAKGADLAGNVGEQVFRTAVQKRRTAVVEALLAKGVDANLGSPIPLAVAAANGDKPMLELLLNHGADINGMGQDGQTALLAAATGRIENPMQAMAEGNKDRMEEFKQCLELLLSKGADVHATRGFSKLTPLHVAARSKNIAGSELLVAAGADVNAKDTYDATPLHWAVINNSPEIVKLLLEKGADPNAPLSARAAVVTSRAGEVANPFSGTDAGGKVPLALASTDEIKNLLKAHGAIIPTGQSTLGPQEKDPEQLEMERVRAAQQNHQP